MKFAKLMELVNTELYISPRHDAWMRENADATYSDAAMQLAQRELGKPDRDRTQGFSASSVNSCGRAQQFTYIGMPQRPPTDRLAGIFHNGTFTHLRWQMAGLTAGWLEQAEVPIPPNIMKLSGTADGICTDGSVLEIKSINSNGYRNVVQFGAKIEHQFQLATYLMAFDKEMGRFIYENKDTQDYVEIPFHLDEAMRHEIQLRAQWLWDHTRDEHLFDPLEKCWDHEGKFKTCAYRDVCLGVKNWDEAQALVRVSA